MDIFGSPELRTLSLFFPFFFFNDRGEMQESAEPVSNPACAVEEVGYALFSSQQLQQGQKQNKKQKKTTSIMQHASIKLLNYSKAAENVCAKSVKKGGGPGVKTAEVRHVRLGDGEVTWALVQSALGTDHRGRLEPCGSQRSSTD